MKKEIVILALTAVFSAGSVAGCGGASNTATNSGSTGAAPKAPSADTITVGLDADPPKLDPKLSSALVDRQVMINIYDTLFTLGPNSEIVPDLVDKYEVSPDGKTYTLHLHQGVTFQDGTPFNAAAVKFNLERDLEKDSLQRTYLKPIQKVDTPDDNTVVIHLNEPYSPLLSLFADRPGMMVSPTAVQKEGADFVNHPVGTGPYAFKERVKGDHITLVKNDHYWQSGEPHFNTVVFKSFTDPNVELANLQSGAVQMIDTMPAQQVASMQQNSNFTVINEPGLGFQGFYVNVQSPPFNNKYLRQAVNEALDRSVIVNTLFKGAAVPGYSPFSKASFAYNEQEDTPPTPNADTVKKLLAEGGKPSGFQFEFQTSSSPVSAQMAQIIQSMLGQYGIQMTIKQLEFGTLLNNSEKHNFQANQLGWSGRVDPDQNIYGWFYTGGSLNDGGYSNPQVDQLLNQARHQLDPKERSATYAKIMDIIHNDAAYIYLYHQNNIIAFNKHITGFQYRADGLLRMSTVNVQ